MATIEINSSRIHFIGLFKYEPTHVLKQNKFIASNIYNRKEAKSYFHQKYYPNWLNSLFLDGEQLVKIGLKNFTSNHLILKKDNPFIIEPQYLKVGEKNIEFSISSIEVFLFHSNLGVFIIKTNLSKCNLNWEDITSFINAFRKTTINDTYIDTNSFYTLNLIENVIIESFHSQLESWRQYNPHLKTASFIDIPEQPKDDYFDKFLFDLGTYTSPISNNHLYSSSERFKNEILKNNVINIYRNWRTLCLFDSLTRIAINLDKKDSYRLWENEYILIYIYLIFIRYYLYTINSRLLEARQELSKSKLIQDEFSSFINDFDYVKISFKNLPNVIFQKLKYSLDISEEINMIERKNTRLNNKLKEQKDSRLNTVLVFLTFLTLISVAHDSGSLVSEFIKDEAIKSDIHLTFSFLVIVLSVIIMLFLYRKGSKNK